MEIPTSRASRGFLTWRALYGACIGLLSGIWIVVGSQDVGTAPAWWMIVLGLVPTICVLASGLAFPRRVYAVALAHDLALLILLIAALLFLPNYLALVVLSPLAPFIVEGCVLYMGIISSRRRISRDL